MSWTYDPNNKHDVAFMKDVALEIHKLKNLSVLDAIIEKPTTYTPREVAEIAKRDYGTILDHIKRGILVSKKSGKNYIITHENLHNYINQ